MSGSVSSRGTKLCFRVPMRLCSHTLRTQSGTIERQIKEVLNALSVGQS
jgi:hypothetical protein